MAISAHPANALTVTCFAIAHCLLGRQKQVRVKTASNCSVNLILAMAGSNDVNLVGAALQAMCSGKEARKHSLVPSQLQPLSGGETLLCLCWV